MKGLFAGAAAALALLGAASSAQAAVITWTLQDVIFDDGGTASGFFDYDTTLGTAENFHITTTDGYRLAGFDYDTSTSYYYGANLFIPNSLFWAASDLHRYILLGFTGSLSTPGTMDLASGAVTPDYGYECDACNPYRAIMGGSVTGSVAAVPEPASWALMLTGFLGAGAALRTARRRQASLTA